MSSGAGRITSRRSTGYSRCSVHPNRTYSWPPLLAKELYILGITRQGKTFRPSDWAERLAGVMSQFRPGGRQPGQPPGLFALVRAHLDRHR